MLSSSSADRSSPRLVVNGSREAIPEIGGDSCVKYFKITKTWAVKAESEAEAVKLIAADPGKYLDSETVQRTEYKKPQPKTGWGTAVKEQFLGNNRKR
jgi:hypothetical protein